MRQQGFTIIEMMLSVSIIALLAGLSLPVYNSFQTRNELDSTALALVSSLRRAQIYARGAQNDLQWGVRVQSGAITLFRGNVFASRDTAYDEVTTLPPTMAVSGTSEVIFTKLTGLPAAAGSTTLTAANNETRTVTINAKGMVSY